MEVEYANRSLKNVCTIFYEAEKKYGVNMAKKIHLRIDQIASAQSVEQLLQFNVGRCHHLSGNRKNQYAMDLVHPYRLVFTINEHEIQIACIKEIVDYH